VAAPLIEVPCKYLQKPVVLLGTTWTEHILRRHPIFGGQLGMLDLRDTIIDPKVITDAGDGRPEQKIAYYRMAPPPFSYFLVKVHVTIGPKRGTIETAHPVADVPDQEVILWRQR
jgi:hypothetical protein